MNRPRGDVFNPFYVKQLEKYCDELETINERMMWHVKKCNEQSTKIRQLEKSLNEACEYCNCDFLQIEDMYCENNNNGNCKECIKNHFLKEVQNDNQY